MTLRCGECAAGGGFGCLKEMSVTALRTTVIITDTGELVTHCNLTVIILHLLVRTVNMTNIDALLSSSLSLGVDASQSCFDSLRLNCLKQNGQHAQKRDSEVPKFFGACLYSYYMLKHLLNHL